MPCSFCGSEKVAAKGLCANCYYRLKRTGSLEYKRKGKLQEQCSVEGCEQLSVAKTFCQKHYMLSLKYGEPVSSFGYGDRKKHPLYETWRYQVRVKEGRVPEWSDFWVFVDAVGAHPSEQHRARRLDIRRPWGPDNFIWHLSVGSTDTRKEYQRIWRSKNNLKNKGYDLKRGYGISLAEYMEMYEAQKGCCALCGTHKEIYSSEHGRSETLVVDHCHAKGHIRGLLCADCNKGLGSFKDSVEVLEKAKAYLLT